jgi:hypothetical protein
MGFSMRKLFLAALLAPAIAFAQNNYPSPTFNSVTLQNPLTAANGGTGSTTSTGTGSAVLSGSPTLTGTPLAPTAAQGTNTTQLATVAYTNAALGSGLWPGSFTNLSASGTVSGAGFTSLLAPYAPLASPSFTGLSQFTNTTAGASIIRMTGDGATTPNKFVGVLGGKFTIFSSSGASQLLGLTDAGALSVPSLSTTTPIPIASGGTNASTATGATSQLQYLQGSTGSGARSLTNKLQDSVSVLDFAGVDATGATDSTTGIQAAITAVCVKGGTLRLPTGVYAVSAQLTISCNNLDIAGAGNTATQIISSATGSNVFAFSGTHDGLSDLVIVYNSAATAGAAVSLSAANQFVMDNVSIINAFHGLDVINSGSQYFTNLFFTNTTPTNGVTIYINGGGDQYFRNIISDNTAGAQPLAGFRVNASGGIWVDGVDFIHSGTGMLIDPQTSGNAVTYFFVSNSSFDSNTGNGITIAPTTGATVAGMTFTGSWTSSSNFGVSIGGTGTVNGVRFVGHRAFNNQQSGFVVPGGSTTNLYFNDCDVAGNSQASAGTFSGFDIGAGISGFSITNSHSGQEAIFGNSQSRGIIVEPGASNNYVLMGNDVRGNVSNAIFDGGTGATKIIKGNLGFNPIANTSIAVGASPFTYTNNTGDTANIFVNGGAVSSITIAGATAATSSNVVVPLPQGKSVVVTYSSAPTMSYMGY